MNFINIFRTFHNNFRTWKIETIEYKFIYSFTVCNAIYLFSWCVSFSTYECTKSQYSWGGGDSTKIKGIFYLEQIKWRTKIQAEMAHIRYWLSAAVVILLVLSIQQGSYEEYKFRDCNCTRSHLLYGRQIVLFHLFIQLVIALHCWRHVKHMKKGRSGRKARLIDYRECLGPCVTLVYMKNPGECARIVLNKLQPLSP